HWYWNALPGGPPYRDMAEQLPFLCNLLQVHFSPQAVKATRVVTPAVPDRAPPRERAASSGTTSPNPRARVNRRRIIENALQLTIVCASLHAGEPLAKASRDEKYTWYLTKPGEPNEMEVLFHACINCVHADSVADLQTWAKQVHSHLADAEALEARWQPPVAEWPLRNGVSTAFDRMEGAWTGVRNEETLDTVAAAMRLWDGPGRVDGLTGKRLSNYMHRGLLATSKSPKKKKNGPPRWRSWMIVYVAELIHKHGVALRKALKLDGMEVDEVPTAHERALAAEARVAELELDLGGLSKQLKKAADAQRKAKERKGEQTAARREAAKKKTKVDAGRVKQRVEAAKAKMEAKVEEKAKRKLEAAEAALEARAEDDVAKRAKEVSVARARARAVEKEAKEAVKLRKRALAAEAKVTSLAEKLDEVMEQQQRPDSPSVPVPKAARRSESGRFEALPWEVRPLIYGQHARRTPPTAIAANISDVLHVYAKEKVVPMPLLRELQKMRGELTVAGECMAAFRVALAKRIVSFGFDESTKFGFGLMSTNTQIEPHDAPGTTEDVVQRGAALTAGGTAEEICKSIDTKIFSHSRRLLNGWRGEHEVMFGKGSWAADGGPSPEAIGLHRLSEQTLLMSDTCNAARAAKRLPAEAAEKAGRLAIGDAAWAKLSEVQRERACTCFIGDCHQHLRNIVINAMAIAATAHLKDVLEDVSAGRLETRPRLQRSATAGGPWHGPWHLTSSALPHPRTFDSLRAAGSVRVLVLRPHEHGLHGFDPRRLQGDA
ncbi:hypothetical protein OAO87_02280, partial [bacterium]|nr:hypothetical protein [bacterium]